MSLTEFHPHQLCIAGYSNSGKTTLLESLFKHFSSSDYKVGYTKHDIHQLNLDKEGKDTDKIWKAGAQSIYAHNADNQFHRTRKQPSFQQHYFNDCDFVLIEGHKQSPFPKIIFLNEDESVWEEINEEAKASTIALIGVHDKLSLSSTLPYFQRDQLDSIASFILNHFKSHTQQTELLGVVMSGGHSTRMGQDKNFLTYKETPQVEVAYHSLKKVCDSVVVSCRADQDISLPTLNDTFLNQGPLGGLLSTFQAYPNHALLVIACDLPRLTEATLKNLISKRNPFRKATVFEHPESKQLEPLCTIYEPSIRPILFEALAHGMRSPKRILEQSHIQVISLSDTNALTNSNTMEDFQSIQSSL